MPNAAAIKSRGDGTTNPRTGRANPKFHAASTFRKNPSRRFASVEIEVGDADAPAPVVEWVTASGARIAGTALDRVAARWRASVVTDGSLHSCRGFEINTAPANGDALFLQLDEIAVALRAVDARATAACGVHVHVDARDVGYRGVRRAAILWNRVEEAMFAAVRPSRATGRVVRTQYGRQRQQCWSKPIRDVIGPSLGLVTEDVDATTAERLVRRVVDGLGGDRYFGMNLLAFARHSTIEFRLHEATTKGAELKSWSALCATIVDAAQAMSLDAIASLPDDPRAALLQIVGGPRTRLGRYLVDRWNQWDGWRMWTSMTTRDRARRSYGEFKAHLYLAAAHAPLGAALATDGTVR